MLSDRDSTADLAPIPSLLLTAAVHQHLVREQTRTQVALIVESGDCREVHHAAVLIGLRRCGGQPVPGVRVGRGPDRHRRAGGVEPATGGPQLRQGARQGRPEDHVQDGHLDGRPRTAARRSSRRSAWTRGWWTATSRGTPARSAGSGLAGDRRRGGRPARARRLPGERRRERRRTGRLDVGGEYQWRREGELHLFNPETVFLLQHATRSRQYDIFRQYTSTVDELAAEAGSLRGLFALRTGDRPAVPIDEVEPASEIVKRFATGAMSYGSISAEAHETLAIAMNRLGGQVQHRRGRRGRRPAARPGPPLGGQAGRQRPVRGDQRIPGQRRRPADQDGAGREARRGWPAARQQGLAVDRPDPARHPGGRA